MSVDNPQFFIYFIMLNYQQKERLIKDLSEKAQTARAIFFVNFSGLNTAKINNLRRELKKQNVVLKIAKKTLAEIALQKIGLIGNLNSQLNGSLAINFVYDDIFSAVKTLWSFHRQNNEVFKISGGILDGNFISQQEVESLAKMPPREVLLGRLVGSFASPLQKLTWILKSNLQMLVFTLNEIKNNKN